MLALWTWKSVCVKCDTGFAKRLMWKLWLYVSKGRHQLKISILLAGSKGPVLLARSRTKKEPTMTSVYLLENLFTLLCVEFAGWIEIGILNHLSFEQASSSAHSMSKTGINSPSGFVKPATCPLFFGCAKVLPILKRSLEGWWVPQFHILCWLDIIVTIDQQGRLARCMQPVAIDHWLMRLGFCW